MSATTHTKINWPYMILLALAILLTLGAIPMIYIAASPNYETLIEFGRRLYGEELAWTLPAATIGYEILATISFFLIPAHLATVRKTAAIGAIAGFALTVILAMAWVIIHGGEDVAMKVIMKIVPSAVVAGYMHLVVNVWHAVETAHHRTPQTSTQVATETPQTPVSAGPTQEEIEAMVAARVDEALAAFTKLMPPPEPPKPVATPDPKPATRRVARPPAPRQEPVIAKPVIATPEPVAPVAVLPEPLPEPLPDTQDRSLAIFEAEIAALPETDPEPIAEPISNEPEPIASEPGNLLDMPWEELRKLLPAGLSAAPVHVELAMKKLRKAGDKQHEIKSGKILKDFHGVQDRQVRNALKIARIRLSLEPLPIA